MENNMLQYCKVIGKIQTMIAKSDNFDDAVRGGLKIILENCSADYAVIWYANKNDENTVYPYYWICPTDLTSRSYKKGEGIVGEVYESGNAVTVFDFKSNPDKASSEDFAGLDISSLICTPLSGRDKIAGCVEFIKVGDHGIFSEEEADMCRILTLLTSIISEPEEAPLSDGDRKNKVLISAKNIKKSFRNGDIVTNVLKGVNFDVFDGEFLCFLGESGCGKSTMLNIIGGMDQADEGTLCFMDKDLSGASQSELTKYRRDNIGFIFQSYNLMPNLNVKQNIDLIRELVPSPMKTSDVLALVGMDKKQKNYPSQLSGGQQQRVSIARALVKNPKLILADEPTAALDYTTSIEVLTALEDVIASGTTVVMVTHNEEITRMANRVIRFRNGQTYEITVNKHPVKATELVW